MARYYARPKFSDREQWFGICSDGHIVYARVGAAPSQGPGLAEKFCNFQLRDEQGVVVGACRQWVTWYGPDGKSRQLP